jgi:hypothetical protein
LTAAGHWRSYQSAPPKGTDKKEEERMLPAVVTDSVLGTGILAGAVSIRAILRHARRFQLATPRTDERWQRTLAPHTKTDTIELSCHRTCPWHNSGSPIHWAKLTGKTRHEQAEMILRFYERTWPSWRVTWTEKAA